MRAKGSGQARGLSYDSDYPVPVLQYRSADRYRYECQDPLSSIWSSELYLGVQLYRYYRAVHRTSIQLKIVNAQHS